MPGHVFDCDKPFHNIELRLLLPTGWGEIMEEARRLGLRTPRVVIEALDRNEAEDMVSSACLSMAHALPARLVRVVEARGGAFFMKEVVRKPLSVELSLKVGEDGPLFEVTAHDTRSLWRDKVLAFALWVTAVASFRYTQRGLEPLEWRPGMAAVKRVVLGGGHGRAVVEVELPAILWAAVGVAASANNPLMVLRGLAALARRRELDVELWRKPVYMSDSVELEW